MATIDEYKSLLEAVKETNADPFQHIGRERVLFIYSREVFRQWFCSSKNDPTSVIAKNRIVFAMVKEPIDPKFRRISTNNKLVFPNAIVIGENEFNGIEFVRSFEIMVGEADNASIVFKKCTYRNKVKILNNKSESGEDDPNNYQKLKKLAFIDCYMIHADNVVSPYIRAEYLEVDDFSIQQLRMSKDTDVNIGDCYFKNCRFSNIRNSGKFKIYNINNSPDHQDAKLFQLDNTSIGDADFQSINLASFRKWKIYDNILSEIDYSNVQWGNQKNHIRVGPDNIANIAALAKKRDTYRALKNVAQNNNDLPQAFAFYAKEMKYHRKIVKSSKGNRQEKIILGFNRWTNDFGQSWLLPVAWVGVAGVTFYILLLFSLGEYPFKLENWRGFFIFLNPTHKTDFIDGFCWNVWADGVDLLFRAFEGALIYQAIQAFRKYSRKF